MAIAALVTWLATAVGGLVMLGTWIAKGGAGKQPHADAPKTRLAPPVLFGHFALAAIGLVLWVLYVLVGGATLAWVALVLLVPVALLGFVMLFRWIPSYRARGAAASQGPAERHFPVPVVLGHGVLAVATVVLALLAALGL